MKVLNLEQDELELLVIVFTDYFLTHPSDWEEVENEYGESDWLPTNREHRALYAKLEAAEIAPNRPWKTS